MSDMEVFWIIWNPHGETPPKKEYKSEAYANMIAKTMAKKFPGEIFHVMRSERCFQKQTKLEKFSTGCKDWTRQ